LRPTLAPVARVDRLERLTDLVLVLLNTKRPLTLRELGDAVPGFPPEGEARRQAFERDKRTLRDQGIAVVVEPIEGPEQMGYRIRPEDFYLPDLLLEPDEQAALNVAVAEVHLGDPSGRDALWRLGIPSPQVLPPVAALPSLPALPALFDAVRSRSSVTFEYRGEQRHIDPALLRFRHGRWYIVGFDRDRKAARTFRVDRVEGSVSVGKSGSTELPEGFDGEAALPDDPWKIGEEETRPVRVLIDSLEGPRVVQQLGDNSVSETRDDGSVVVELQVSNEEALISWVLALGPHAEVLSPPKVRAGVVQWLRSFDDSGRGGDVR
jgi:proteasome accessory factor B